MDGVLVRNYTMLAFGRLLLQRGIIDRQGWLSFYSDFKSLWRKQVSYEQFAENAVRHFSQALAGRRQMDVLEAGKACADRMKLYWYARPLADTLRQRGVKTIAVSGAPDECLHSLARALRLDEAYGSLAAVDASGIYTGQVQRNMALGVSKGAIVRELTARFEVVAAFGDSEQDIPMLETARYPVAVNARAALSRTAMERGWTLLSFHNNLPARVAELVDSHR